MIRLSLILATLFFTTTASSANITFSNTHFNNGVGHGGGSFDISSFISNEMSQGYNVDINSATLSLRTRSLEHYQVTSYRTDEIIIGSHNVPYEETYACGRFFLDTCTRTVDRFVPTFYTRHFIVDGDHETDQIRVDFDSLALTTRTGGLSETHFTDRHGSNTISGRVFGDSFQERNLSTIGLVDLINDQFLNYNFLVSAGMFEEIELGLELNYDRVQIVSAVPLPATILLLGPVLSGLVVVRRKKRNS